MCAGVWLVRSIVMLDFASPEPCHGCWGCLVCGLPQIGAVAVLCNACVDRHQAGEEIPLFCLGYAAENRRAPRSSLGRPIVHDMTKHAEDDEEDWPRLRLPESPDGAPF